MELHLKISGIVLILLSFVHVIFPKYFNWKKELESLNLINKQLMHVHTFFVALVVFLMGFLCYCCAEDIANTKLGKQIALGLFIFWFTRLIFQFFVYSPKLWKGKLFETVIHIIFSLIWIYLTLVFFFAFRNK